MAILDGRTTEPTTALWQEAEREQAYWTEYYAELLREHPEEFVAVRDGRVIAHSPDLPQLLATLARDGIAPTYVCVRFITRDPHRLTP
jgi:hypothetical protein